MNLLPCSICLMSLAHFENWVSLNWFTMRFAFNYSFKSLRSTCSYFFILLLIRLFCFISFSASWICFSMSAFCCRRIFYLSKGPVFNDSRIKIQDCRSLDNLKSLFDDEWFVPKFEAFTLRMRDSLGSSCVPWCFCRPLI